MDKVIEYINNIKKQKNVDKDISRILDELNDLIKDVLKRKINELKIDCKLNPWVNNYIETWRCPIKWELHSYPISRVEKTEKSGYILSLDVDQQLLIFTKVEEINECINSTKNEIQKLCNSKYILCTERYLLNKLHELYKNLRGGDEKDLQKIITRCFNVKYVEFEGDYKCSDYFESSGSDVDQPETRYEAMVFLRDDSCIEKGLYLYPHNNK